MALSLWVEEIDFLIGVILLYASQFICPAWTRSSPEPCQIRRAEYDSQSVIQYFLVPECTSLALVKRPLRQTQRPPTSCTASSPLTSPKTRPIPVSRIQNGVSRRPVCTGHFAAVIVAGCRVGASRQIHYFTLGRRRMVFINPTRSVRTTI